MGIFRKAERRKATLKLALAGPAGSGKTHSALLLASGLIDDPSGDTIAVIDTENGSAELESGKPGIPPFSVVTLAKPYAPERYTEVVDAAVAAGFKVLIIDSISPEWGGAGGILTIVDALKGSTRNQMAAWKEATPRHQRFVDSLIQAPLHVICTMRSKSDYAMDRDDQGKTKVSKVGLAPQQRDGIEYEFTLIGEINLASHRCEFTKDRTSLFVGAVPEMVTRATGEKIRGWMEAGADAPAPAEVSLEVDEPQSVESAPEGVPPVDLLEVEDREWEAGGKTGIAVIAKTSDGEMVMTSASVIAMARDLEGSSVVAKVVPSAGKGKLPRLIGLEKATTKQKGKKAA